MAEAQAAPQGVHGRSPQSCASEPGLGMASNSWAPAGQGERRPRRTASLHCLPLPSGAWTQVTKNKNGFPGIAARFAYFNGPPAGHVWPLQFSCYKTSSCGAAFEAMPPLELFCAKSNASPEQKFRSTPPRQLAGSALPMADLLKFPKNQKPVKRARG